MSDAFQYIDTPVALDSLCARLRGQPWIAVDTEFMRERTYYPELCLVQVATDEVVACIDPLALPSLKPLLEVLLDPQTVKVLHAA
ncbi:MAG TPA: ribonuclease D, partial [Gammaproteobacteria bacterium]|nr:ribonuclease D [Gammaproteobacteria bacterium]